MSTRRRVKVIAVVCTGGASVIVSSLRLIFLHEFTVTTDFTYTFGSICIISAAEMEVAILAANMPGLSALYQTCKGAGFSPFLSSTSGSRIAGGPGRSSYPSVKGYIHTSDEAESSSSKNRGDDSCGSSSHRLVTFSSMRTARGRAAPDEDADLISTRQARDNDDLEGGNLASSDVKAPVGGGGKGSGREISSPKPSAAKAPRPYQSGVVVSREVVITNELRTAGEGATADGPERAYYRPPAWKGAVVGRSSSRS